ncbi:MAG: DUF4411 family protein [Verrucomicrobiae bacterium]|nr:DUF4411 family protein [Verrucomicrobiae bacterium]
MRYVFDSNSLINLFKHYYPDRFPSLWERFYNLVDAGNLVSVREVFNEISTADDSLAAWAKEQKHTLFSEPTIEEFQFVTEIFRVPHFQGIIRRKERLKGRPVADPFVIARARILEKGCVVTEENHTENAAKIPNVCNHFDIPCIKLEGFMKEEGWIF